MAAKLLLEALGALVERADAGQRGDQRDVALGLAVFLGDRGGERIGGDAAALHVVGGEERGEGLAVGGAVDADDLYRFRGLVDRLAERRELRRRDHDRRRLLGDRVLEDRNLAVDVGLRLRAEFGHLDAKILSGLARAGQHDLPVERSRVLDDDRNGRRRRRNSARSSGGERDQRGGDKKLLHASSSVVESLLALVYLQLRTSGSCFAR